MESRNVILYQGDLKWTQAKESEKGLIKIFFNTSIMAQKDTQPCSSFQYTVLL